MISKNNNNNNISISNNNNNKSNSNDIDCNNTDNVFRLLNLSEFKKIYLEKSVELKLKPDNIIIKLIRDAEDGLDEFKKIDMSSKNLTDNQVIPLVEALKKDELITEVDFSNNKLRSVLPFTRLLQFNRTIQKLNLSSNQLNENEIPDLIKVVNANRVLKILQIDSKTTIDTILSPEKRGPYLKGFTNNLVENGSKKRNEPDACNNSSCSRKIQGVDDNSSHSFYKENLIEPDLNNRNGSFSSRPPGLSSGLKGFLSDNNSFGSTNSTTPTKFMENSFTSKDSSSIVEERKVMMSHSSQYPYSQSDKSNVLSKNMMLMPNTKNPLESNFLSFIGFDLSYANTVNPNAVNINANASTINQLQYHGSSEISNISSFHESSDQQSVVNSAANMTQQHYMYNSQLNTANKSLDININTGLNQVDLSSSGRLIMSRMDWILSLKKLFEKSKKNPRDKSIQIKVLIQNIKSCVKELPLQDEVIYNQNHNEEKGFAVEDITYFLQYKFKEALSYDDIIDTLGSIKKLPKSKTTTNYTKHKSKSPGPSETHLKKSGNAVVNSKNNNGGFRSITPTNLRSNNNNKGLGSNNEIRNPLQNRLGGIAESPKFKNVNHTNIRNNRVKDGPIDQNTTFLSSINNQYDQTRIEHSRIENFSKIYSEKRNISPGRSNNGVGEAKILEKDVKNDKFLGNSGFSTAQNDMRSPKNIISDLANRKLEGKGTFGILQPHQIGKKIEFENKSPNNLNEEAPNFALNLSYTNTNATTSNNQDNTTFGINNLLLAKNLTSNPINDQSPRTIMNNIINKPNQVMGSTSFIPGQLYEPSLQSPTQFGQSKREENPSSITPLNANFGGELSSKRGPARANTKDLALSVASATSDGILSTSPKNAQLYTSAINQNIYYNGLGSSRVVTVEPKPEQNLDSGQNSNVVVVYANRQEMQVSSPRVNISQFNKQGSGVSNSGMNDKGKSMGNQSSNLEANLPTKNYFVDIFNSNNLKQSSNDRTIDALIAKYTKQPDLIRPPSFCNTPSRNANTPTFSTNPSQNSFTDLASDDRNKTLAYNNNNEHESLSFESNLPLINITDIKPILSTEEMMAKFIETLAQVNTFYNDNQFLLTQTDRNIIQMINNYRQLEIFDNANSTKIQMAGLKFEYLAPVNIRELIVYSLLKTILQYLQVLSIRRCMLNQDTLAMTMIPDNIKVLNLSNNDIIELNCLRLCRNLEFINLSNNKINEIKGFIMCLKLKEIILANNSITIVKNLFKLNHLQLLDLSYNMIKTLDNLNTLKSNPNLKYLSLYGNPVMNQPKSIEIIYQALPLLKCNPNQLLKEYSDYLAYEEFSWNNDPQIILSSSSIPKTNSIGNDGSNTPKGIIKLPGQTDDKKKNNSIEFDNPNSKSSLSDKSINLINTTKNNNYYNMGLSKDSYTIPDQN